LILRGAALGVLALLGTSITACSSRSTTVERNAAISVAALPTSSGTGRHISVDPSTGLENSQHVQVHGTGFRPGVQVAAVTCSAESDTLPVKSNGCETSRPGYATTDSHGSFTMTYLLDRVIATPANGQVDCAARPVRCSVGVGEVATQEGTHAPISFRSGLPSPPPPASTEAPHPALRLTTSGKLRDGMSVQITGSGYGPQQQVAVRECPLNSSCDDYEASLSVTADDAGAFTATITLREIVVRQNGGPDWCGFGCTLLSSSPASANTSTALSRAFDLEPPAPGGGARCHLALLTPSYGGLVETAGSRALYVNLRNPATTPCWLDGYSTVSLAERDGDGDMAFTSVVGGSQIADKPAWIRLDPGGSARFQIAKATCTYLGGPTATTVYFSGPFGSNELKDFPQNPQTPTFEACGDPVKDTLHIGPFTAAR
jgi:hypothetical protein